MKSSSPLGLVVLIAAALAGYAGLSSVVALVLALCLSAYGALPEIYAMKGRFESIEARRVWRLGLAASLGHAVIACVAAYGMGFALRVWAGV